MFTDVKSRKIILIFGLVIYMCVLTYFGYKYFTSNRYIDIIAPNQVYFKSGSESDKIDVKIINRSYMELDSKDKFFLSYHLYDEGKKVISYDNKRSEITRIKPGSIGTVGMGISVPAKKGKYKIELDVVKENEYWFNAKGNAPKLIELIVE